MGQGDPVLLGTFRCAFLNEPTGIAVTQVLTLNTNPNPNTNAHPNWITVTQDEDAVVVTDAESNKVLLIYVPS